MLGQTSSLLFPLLLPSSLYSEHTYTHTSSIQFFREDRKSEREMCHIFFLEMNTTSPIKNEWETQIPNNKYHRTILVGNPQFLELTETSLRSVCKRQRAPGRPCNGM